MATSQALPYQQQSASEQTLLLWVYLGIQAIVCLVILGILGFIYLNHFAPESMLLGVSFDNSAYNNFIDEFVFAELGITAVITILQILFVAGLAFRRIWGYSGLLVIMTLVALNMLISFNSIIAFVVAAVGTAVLWLIVNYTDVYLE